MANVIIGLDNGHGEITATCYRTDSVNGRIDVLNLDKNQNKVIPSVIHYECEKVCIGYEAMAKENAICAFKMPPREWKDLQGNHIIYHGHTVYQLIFDFIRFLFSDILKYNKGLINTREDEIYLYVGCPSSELWLNETALNEYKQLIRIASGVSKVFVVPESRAAIYNSYLDPRLNCINAYEGVIVIDFGSLSADCTYIQMGKYRIERSWRLGASEIERIMFKRLLELSGLDFSVVDSAQVNDIYMSLRNQKERYYSGELNQYSKFCTTLFCTDENGDRIRIGTSKRGVPLYKTVELQNTGVDIDEFMDHVTGNEYFEVSENGECLGQFTWEGACKQFMLEIKKMLDSKNLPYKAVVLTGGASAMYFVSKIAQDVFSGVRVMCEENPSITVARGLSIIGETDMHSSELLCELQDSIETIGIEKYTQYINHKPATIMAEKAFEVMIDYLKSINGDITIGDIKKGLTDRINNEFTQQYISDIIKSGIAEWRTNVIAELTAQTNDKVKKLYNNQLNPDPFELDIDFIKEYFSPEDEIDIDTDKLIPEIDFTSIFSNVISTIISVIISATIIVILDIISFGTMVILSGAVEYIVQMVTNWIMKNEKRVLSINQTKNIIDKLSKKEKREEEVNKMKEIFIKKLIESQASDKDFDDKLKASMRKAADRAFGIVSLTHFEVDSLKDM